MQLVLFARVDLASIRVGRGGLLFGVDETHFTPGEDDRRSPFFLSVGSALRDKNGAFIIRALALEGTNRGPWSGSPTWLTSIMFTELKELARNMGVTSLDVRRNVSDRELFSSTGPLAYFCMLRGWSLSVSLH